MTTLESGVTNTLSRLGDLANVVWARSEISLYYKDGYNDFCRRTKALFDITVIENLPPIGNWQTDLEKYLAEQKSGWGLTDEPFHFTGARGNAERDFGTGGKVAGPYFGPAGITTPDQRTFASSVDATLSKAPTTVRGGLLSQAVVDVVQVTYNGNRRLTGMSSQAMRKLDPTYEIREGDPQYYLWDKDGLYYMRLVPTAAGGAVYDTVDGSWGTRTQTSDTAVSVVTQEVDGHMTTGFGLMTYLDDFDGTGMFPSGGPWGTITRIHPGDLNIEVEIYRLGRDLDFNASELPSAYEKYVAFYAMSQALRRDGPGQDIELADHYESRYEMGINRLWHKVQDMQPERVGQFGSRPDPATLELGRPRLPYPYDTKQW